MLYYNYLIMNVNANIIPARGILTESRNPVYASIVRTFGCTYYFTQTLCILVTNYLFLRKLLPSNIHYEKTKTTFSDFIDACIGKLRHHQQLHAEQSQQKFLQWQDHLFYVRL